MKPRKTESRAPRNGADKRKSEDRRSKNDRRSSSEGQKKSPRRPSGNARPGKLRGVSGAGDGVLRQNDDRRLSVPRAERSCDRRSPRRSDDGGPLLCWGRNPVLDLLVRSPERCERLWLAEGVEADLEHRLAELLEGRSLPLERVDRRELDELTDGAVHQGIAVRVRRPESRTLEDAIEMVKDTDGPVMVVMVDRCQDPRNLGSIMRSAEAAGAALVIIAKDRAVGLTGTVVKASAGAGLRLPLIEVVNLRRAIEAFQKIGFWAVGLDGTGKHTIGSTPWEAKTLLVVGAEGTGLADLTQKSCDFLARIPMAPAAESLNAGVAAALGMYEWARRFSCTEDFPAEEPDDQMVRFF